MEESPNAKLQEMDREGVKMANLTHDLALIDSDAKLTRLRAPLQQFRSSHPGASRMKSIVRTFAYWFGMDKDIEAVVPPH
ncbi:hypothetical protein ACTXT7_002237 [Hymenolepis weldensis]